MADIAEKNQGDVVAPETGEEESGESVEDILNSIRDIIADEDDDEVPAAEEAADSPPPSADEDDDILELTTMAEETPVEQAPDTDVLDEIDEALQSDEGEAMESTEAPKEDTPPPAPAPAPAPEPVAETPPPPPSSGGSDLISEPAAAESASKIKDLVNSIPEESIDSPHFRSGTSVEELVKEALKPMLSEWLNQNLPAVVEKVVAREIKRILPKDD